MPEQSQPTAVAMPAADPAELPDAELPTADPGELPEAMVMIGGSAGSFAPLRELIADLPADLPAAVLVVVHRSERNPSRLAELLDRAGPLPVSRARDGEPIRRGQVYVGPAGRHLMTGHGRIRLRNGPRVNRHRPAIDVLFASTAGWTGIRALAVVLSGVLDDGAVGAALVALAGGQVLVQDPAEAHFPGMPAAALAAATNAWALPSDQLAKGVLDHPTGLGRTGELPKLHVHGWEEAEMDMADSGDLGFLAEGESRLTRLVCPECGGSLAQVDLPRISYFRCHVGHQYAPQTLAAAQAETAEAKLWGAVAALEDQATLLHYLDENGSQQPDADAERRAREIAERAASLRDQVRQWTTVPPGQVEDEPD